jgi:hypothetical protein
MSFWPWFVGGLITILLSVDLTFDLSGRETLSQVIRTAPHAQPIYIGLVLILYLHLFKG